MTDLERRALLGDQEAQKECTEKGIALPCPHCGAKDAEIIKYAFGRLRYEWPILPRCDLPSRKRKNGPCRLEYPTGPADWTVR